MSRSRRLAARHAAPRARRVARPSRLLKTAGLLMITVLLGMVGIGGTLAYLRDAETVSGATVTAGTLTLQINGAPSTNLGAWTPTPATPSAKAFTVTSASHAPATVAAAINVTSTDQIRNFAQLRIVEVPNAAACTNAVTGGVTGSLMSFPASQLTHLTATETQWLCAVISLSSSTSIDRAGESISFNMVLTATQAVS